MLLFTNYHLVAPAAAAADIAVCTADRGAIHSAGRARCRHWACLWPPDVILAGTHLAHAANTFIWIRMVFCTNYHLVSAAAAAIALCTADCGPFHPAGRPWCRHRASLWPREVILAGAHFVHAATTLSGIECCSSKTTTLFLLLLLPLQCFCVSQIVVLFIQLAVLGAAIGLAFGLVTSFWLARIFNEACLEIILTFGAAYACYFVAEELCGASGLLAVVVMGFSMSVMGEQHQTMFNLPVVKHMHPEYWPELEGFIGDSVLPVLRMRATLWRRSCVGHQGCWRW
jgi:hypothetical protein